MNLLVKILVLTLITVLTSSILFSVHSQNRNSIWCFGDSAGIDFRNLSNPIPLNTSLDTRGSAVSIANSVGELLFYANTRATMGDHSTQVWDASQQIMQNGNNIIGEGWYRELVIVPFPSDTNLYYLFSISVASIGGLYYSIIDMTQNGGLGAVMQKNIQLLPNDMTDGLQAIKHGNGRDWWLFCHKWDYYTNEFIRYLITPSSIQGPFIQAIGDTGLGFLNINFSKTGNIAAIVDYSGLFEIFNFDRCTGLFSLNSLYNFPFSSDSLYLYFWTCEISPNEDYLYINQANNYTSYVFQLDLHDSVPWNTRDTVWRQDTINYCAGALELAPDNKIYFSPLWWDGINFFYPFTDSTFGIGNMNLSVINSPDSPSVSCDFQPYSFYLGGKRTYLGLPNNPNYEMSSILGSLCDSLSVSIAQEEISPPKLTAFYHSDWQITFINASNLRGNYYVLTVHDLAGKEIFHEENGLASREFTKDWNCANLSKGVYIISLRTQHDLLTQKIIIQ